MDRDVRSIATVNASYAADTPVPAGFDPYVSDRPSGSPQAGSRTARIAYSPGADALAVSPDADYFGDATAAPEDAASPFSSFYSPVNVADDLDVGDVTSDDTDKRHAALDKTRLSYQMRTSEALRNMQESLDVAESGTSI